MSSNNLVTYGKQSTLIRWFDQYWSVSDRQALPWLIVIVLGVFIAFGPQFLIWLVGLLPVDDLGNSGASIFAHQVVIAIASLLGLGATLLLLRRLSRPAFLEVGADGVALVWNVLFVKVRGIKVQWPQIIAINILQPLDKTDFRAAQLKFVSADVRTSLSIPLDQIQGDERRHQVGEAISKFAVHPVEPRVFSELSPQKELSFTSLWLEALTAAPCRASLTPLPVGTILDGRYCVQQLLGSGGQGTVYLANDQGDATQVVLKESILPVYADIVSRRQALELFHKEAFALAGLQHDGIVRYLSSFVADHRAYLVLQLVPGRTLAAVIKEDGPIESKRATALFIQMCDILSYLHSQAPPLVHRDFTPDNLIISVDDRVTLIDFAVSVSAWSLDGFRTATSDGDCEVAGKISYMAPEQVKGTPQGQSDIYSLGAVMHYILTGETAEPLTETHPILTNETVSKQLSDVVAGATRLDLANRFQTAALVKDALQKSL